MGSKVTHNKVVKFTPVAKATCAGLATRCFASPLPRR